jgi:hypothetical protein
MVTRILHDLAGPALPFRFEEPWPLQERNIQRLLSAWEHVCRQATQNGSAEELHATRDDYQAVLQGNLKILDGFLMLLSRFHGEHPHTEFTERITRSRDRLQQHYDSLFPRWQTLDDLEAILLEQISLSNDRLKALAEKHKPPQSWYDEAEAPAPQE